MRVARRHCWPEEDRPAQLMPCADPLWLVEAPLALARFTGIDVNAVPVAEVSVFAVPVAEDDWVERGLRRWEGTRAEAMWHPLLWLPERLAAPVVAVTGDGAAVEEPAELWQARVAFEVVDSGLYTADGWVDVYALLGLDVDCPADVARVRAWLDGTADPLLDGFDLESFVADDVDEHDGPDRPSGLKPDHDPDPEPGGWAAAMAADVGPLLAAAATALMADSLLGLAYDLTDPENRLDDDAYARGAWWLVSLAIEAVAERDTADTWLAVLDAIQSSGAERDAVAAALRPTLRLLTEPRDEHWPALTELQRFVGRLDPRDESILARPAPPTTGLTSGGERPSTLAAVVYRAPAANVLRVLGPRR
ncbi:hypothetical protein [Microlunatus ginsengisoli]|uniref:DUF4192 family protein n=1 Tax=Microlunatus ginsengisoli TaxID=363863 RepID=A0ABP7AKX0_9ACTN